MKKIIAITTVILSLSWMVLEVQSQTMTLPEEREFLLNALKILDEYEYNSTLKNNEMEGDYMALFADENQQIFNDLLGLSDAEQLPLSEYVKLFRNGVISPSIKLKNVRRGDIHDTGESIEIPIFFDKELRYNNNCGAILSSKAYYDKDYEMEMLISMDKATKEMQIVSLMGKIDSNMPRLGSEFAIVEYDDPRDKNVTNNGRKLNFNVFDQAFIPIPYNLMYPDDDENMRINKSEGDCNKLNLSFHPRRYIIKPHVNITLGKSFSISETSSMMNVSSSSMEFGVDFGYAIPMKGNFKINVFTGLGYSTGKINLDVGDLNYNYSAPASADDDGVPYTRYYEISDLSQGISLGHLILPIYGDFEYRFGGIFSAFVQLGFKMYFNAGSKVNSFTGNMYAYGIYPEYGDLMINAPYMNDFGYSTIDENVNNDLKLNGFSLDGIGGIGIRAKIYGPLSVEAGVNYQIGFTNMIVNQRDPGELRSGSITENQAFATYTANGGTVLHSLTDYVGNIKRSSLKLNIGLILKF